MSKSDWEKVWLKKEQNGLFWFPDTSQDTVNFIKDVKVAGDKLQEDLLEALRVGWDCSCGRGWYDIEKSEDTLWKLCVKYGVKEE